MRGLTKTRRWRCTAALIEFDRVNDVKANGIDAAKQAAGATCLRQFLQSKLIYLKETP